MDELLVNNTPQSTATLQRQQNEDSNAEAFINKLHSEGEKESLLQSGFFLTPKTSSKGIITDQEESNSGIVEFKYIQVKPGETL